nr:CHASE2 domain-containing protein [Luteimonas salinisoli]
MCVSGLLARDLTWRIDTWIYDALLAGTQQDVDERIVVVAIDERSLAALGRWPWPRDTHARLLDRLHEAGARGVALNVVFAEPARDGGDGDARLAAALARSGRAVLPVMAEPSEPDGMLIEVLPMPDLIEAAAGLGHVEAAVDRDGVARDAYLRAGLGSAHWPALALALLEAGTAPPAALPGTRDPQPRQPSPYHWVRDHRIMVPYAPDAFAQVSYLDVLQGRAGDALLHDRWVLVGTTAAGIDQGVPSPLTGPGRSLPAIAYHANLLNTLLLDQAIAPLTRLQQWILAIGLVLLPVMLYGGSAPWRRPWAMALLGVAVTLLSSALLLRYGRYWFPPAATVAVLTAGSAVLALWRPSRSHRTAADVLGQRPPPGVPGG